MPHEISLLKDNIMVVPPGFTEEQVLAEIESIVRVLAPSFKFGCYDTSDMQQEGRLFALEALSDYDASRGASLHTFLTHHIRNRFINLRRDKFERRKTPCEVCPFYSRKPDRCGAFACQSECDRWVGWNKRNAHKKSLMGGYNPSTIVENTPEEIDVAEHCLNKMFDKEVVEYVDKNIPLHMRADYCKLLHGVKLPKVRRDKVIKFVRELVQDKYGEDFDG